MVYDPFEVLLDLGCQYFVEDFCIYVHQRYWTVIFFFVVSLSGFGIRVMAAHRMSFSGFFPLQFFGIVSG